MTFKNAIKAYSSSKFDTEMLQDQETAYKKCLEFLEGVTKIKRQNATRTSYGLKHIVESPSGRFGIPKSSQCYNGYVYEGTFILAALASGFTAKQIGKGLSVTFNISEPSLQQRTKIFADETVNAVLNKK